jgi:hypothetical protein
MTDQRSDQRSYLGYCLLAVILFGCYVLLNRFRTTTPQLWPRTWYSIADVAPLFL